MIAGTQPYQISNEYNVANMLEQLDANVLFDILEEKLNNISFSKSIIESNIVGALNANFKAMNEQYPGDSQNIREIRREVYTNIISILTKKFNLEFNSNDETIDLYTAAYYLYDFLVCNRNNIMINFFVAFIVNNKDSLYASINTEEIKRNNTVAYGKRVYVDNKFAAISANIGSIINNISTLDIRLVNIFQSTYKSQELVAFLDNAFADRGNFFKDYYCSIINNKEELPIIITNIRLALQNVVGNTATNTIGELLSYTEGDN